MGYHEWGSNAEWCRGALKRTVSRAHHPMPDVMCTRDGTLAGCVGNRQARGDKDSGCAGVHHAVGAILLP